MWFYKYGGVKRSLRGWKKIITLCFDRGRREGNDDTTWIYTFSNFIGSYDVHELSIIKILYLGMVLKFESDKELERELVVDYLVRLGLD